MVTTASRSRTASPARWARAVERAIAEGVTVRQLATSGIWVASSGTDADTCYALTTHECECYAGAHADEVCKHRAALRVRLGMLTAPVVAIEPVAAPVVEPEHRMCTDCLDTGWARMYLGYGLNDYTDVPCGCRKAVAA